MLEGNRPQDPRKASSEDSHPLPSDNLSKARQLSGILARRVIDELVPKIEGLWNTNVCLATKVVDGSYQLVLTGDVNRDSESLAFDTIKSEMVSSERVVTIDYVEYEKGWYLQRCRTGVASNVNI